MLLTTTSDDSSLETRPMSILRIEEPGTLLFFASQVSPLVRGGSRNTPRVDCRWAFGADVIADALMGCIGQC